MHRVMRPLIAAVIVVGVLTPLSGRTEIPYRPGAVGAAGRLPATPEPGVPERFSMVSLAASDAVPPCPIPCRPVGLMTLVHSGGEHVTAVPTCMRVSGRTVYLGMVGPGGELVEEYAVFLEDNTGTLPFRPDRVAVLADRLFDCHDETIAADLRAAAQDLSPGDVSVLDICAFTVCPAARR